MEANLNHVFFLMASYGFLIPFLVSPYAVEACQMIPPFPGLCIIFQTSGKSQSVNGMAYKKQLDLAPYITGVKLGSG